MHRRTLMRLIAAMAVCVALVVVVGPKASAHDQLVSTTPSANASVPAVTKVTLTYSDKVLSIGTVVRVTGPDGKSITVGNPRVTKNAVAQALTADLPGRYTVLWRVGSADGHPIDGSFTFTVAATGSPASPSKAKTAPVAPSADPPSVAPSAKPAAPPAQHRAGSAIVLLIVILAAGWLLLRKLSR